ncbi:MAG: hypothetical protein KF878_11530 [Planctomycetes bacterium]|nr:hypothetical protein [Planctomycetota bacterium]
MAPPRCGRERERLVLPAPQLGQPVRRRRGALGRRQDDAGQDEPLGQRDDLDRGRVQGEEELVGEAQRKRAARARGGRLAGRRGVERRREQVTPRQPRAPKTAI